MAIKVGMPNLGHTMEEGTVVSWLKQPGEAVTRGEPLAEVESDKVVFTIEAPASGTLLNVLVAAEGVAKVGQALGYIGAAGEAAPEAERPAPSAMAAAAPIAAPAPTPVAPSAGRITAERARISPLARRLAQEHGLDPEQLTGTGPRGSVTQENVLAAVAARAAAPANGSASRLPVAERRPLRAIRRTIAQRMTQSWQQAPHVTEMIEADMSAADTFRKAHNLSFTDLIIAAAARALVAHPQLNAALVDDTIETYGVVNIGLAVALEGGLVTPVLREANKRSLAELSEARRVLTDKATRGQLALDDLADGTFTISNLGAEGIRYFTPILNPPQAAILGVGAIAPRAVVINGGLHIRTMLDLSLSFDHRVVDGLPAARFLGQIKALLEDPDQLAT
ncbi:MAG: 2-oxo acid dehydrogenase subunit E2 [Anaerolineales bacterium]|nr:2-oxo acid dehydrogenase subunit E2 [Anaerolineales bacterium]